MAKRKEVETIEPQTALSKTAKADIALAEVHDIVVAPEAPIKFVGNYAVVTSDIEATIGKYKKLKITDANYAEGELAKKMCQTLRTNISNRMKEWKDQYITLPSDTEQAKFQKVLALVKEIEESLDKQFAVFEEERAANLTLVLDEYRDTALVNAGYDLTSDEDAAKETRARVVYPKKYYNKGQKEADSKADLETQVKAMRDADEEVKRTEDLVRTMCKEDDRLNVDVYLENLKYLSASTVMQQIITEKERLKTVNVGATNEKVVAGLSIGSGKGKKNETKTMKIKITYPSSSGAKLKKFFDDNPEITVVTIV